MADPRAVAIRRQNAGIRLRKATEAAAQKFGVAFKVPGTPPTRHPDLYAAELVENVAEFIEQITGTPQSAVPKQRRSA